MGEKLQDNLAYPPRAMNADRAAAYIGLGKTKFLELVQAGRMPKPIEFDGAPRWDRFELDAAVEDWKDKRKDPVQRDRERLREMRGRPLQDNDDED
jgi:predicted DNA-binding transcriptional regulator AlpA